MRIRHWKPVAAIVVLVLTVGVFIGYFREHPEVGELLRKTDPFVLCLLLGLHLTGVAALAGVMLATLQLCRLRLPLQEGLLLTAYSSVVNFFGPLQSGPAFRAVYLKARHNIDLKSYASATLVYYFFYGLFSSLMVLSGLHSKWLILALVMAIVGLAIALRLSPVRNRLRVLNLRGWYLLAAATLAQCLAVLMVYLVELRTFDASISLAQAIVYTGAANLSLFVSITPGAIGFRESFLLFSQQLHHVPNDVIAAASILDRAVYITLLVLLAIFIVATHTRARLLKTKS
jgi:uncharacterized membrane protein YbhN (UPF0104 family)